VVFASDIINTSFMATKKKKDLNNSKNETHYFGALLENMDSKIDVMLEGHQVLDKKIGDLKDDMNKRFNEVDYKLETVFGELHLIHNDLKEFNLVDIFF